MKNTRPERHKIPIEQIQAAYEEHGSVKAAGLFLGVSHATVHRRLQAIGYPFDEGNYSPALCALIIDYYENTPAEVFSLKDFAASVNKKPSCICTWAAQNGYTNKKRLSSDATKLELGVRSRKQIQENGHPRGMLGKKHSPETRKILSRISKERNDATSIEERAAMSLKALKTKAERGTLINFRPHTTWKAAWHEIGGKRHYFRSSWEVNYAYYLQWLKSIGEITDWEFEPEVFWFEKIRRGVMSYLPDFRVTEKDGRIIFHEVKGWMDDRSRTKLARMAKYYPDVNIIVVDKKGYYALDKKVNGLVPGWRLGRAKDRIELTTL